jgi:hypothetical protein
MEPTSTLHPCNPECRFAEPMHGNYADWVWCTRPETHLRTRVAGSDCPSFTPRGAFDEPPST